MGTVALREVQVQGGQASERNPQPSSRDPAAASYGAKAMQVTTYAAAELANAEAGEAFKADGTSQPMGMAMSITLEWGDLRYTVPLGGRGICCMRRARSERTILSGLSAVMPPGRLLAIMGPTGCGKTSLINALAGRLPIGGTLEGQVLVNGLPRGKGFRAVSAYVMQDDVLFHDLTVCETLDFAARMRLPASVPPAAKAARVDATIAQLGLAGAANTYVGNAVVRGVSGGERKRVNIAIELLSNPSLLFTDEPTSGLDAFQAQSVVESLSQLAKSGRSVLATIHQPRSSVFQMFDLLLVLSEGKTVFYGRASEAVAWFASCGFLCPEHHNPADFFADLVARDRRTPEADGTSQARIQELVDRFQRHQAESNIEASFSNKWPQASLVTLVNTCCCCVPDGRAGNAADKRAAGIP
ncbi:hypothetical protein ABPG77_009045 [Micractinium sp. CCAP 211/92]